jgi:hypothetical protein
VAGIEATITEGYDHSLAARAAAGYSCSRSSRRRISRSYPGRWTIGPAIRASGPRRPAAARPTFSMRRHHRIRRYRRFVGTRGGPLSHRCSDPGTRHRRSGVIEDPPHPRTGLVRIGKAALKLCGSLHSRADRPVPWWAHRSAGLGVRSMNPDLPETDRSVLYDARSRIALFDPRTLALSRRERGAKGATRDRRRYRSNDNRGLRP